MIRLGRSPNPLLGILVLAVSNAACEGASERTTSLGVTRVDSAGVVIVTSETAADDVAAYATLDSVPTLRLGSADGVAEEQFGHVAGLAPLSDGGVAVLDQQAAEVRVFGPDGTYLRAIGHKGEGPGELAYPFALASLARDVLVVYDWGNGRVTHFTLDGEVDRISTLQLGGHERPYFASFFGDGSMVGYLRLEGVRQRLNTNDQPAFLLDSAALVLTDSNGVLKDTIGVFPGFEVVSRVYRMGDDVSIGMVPAAFARTLVFAAVPNGVWVGFSDDFSLRLVDPNDGRVTRILRAPGLQRPLTNREADAVLDSALASATEPEDRRTTEEWYEVSPRSAQRPAYDRLVVDDEGRLWLRDWPGAYSDVEHWWVFDREGALLGSADAPRRAQLIAVRNGQAWALLQDDLGVECVVRYTMHTLGV